MSEKRNTPESADAQQSLRSASYHLHTLELEIETLFEASLGEVTDEIETFEQYAERKRETLLEALARYVSSLDARIGVGKAEIDRVRSVVVEASERRKVWAQDRIRETMARARLRKAEAGPFVVTITKPRKRVELEPGAEIPDAVRVVKTETRLDKAEAKRIIAAGGNLPGVRLVEGEQGVRIK